MPSKKRDYTMSNSNYHQQAMPQPKRMQHSNVSAAVAAPPPPLPTSNAPKSTTTATAAVVVHPQSKEKAVSDTKKKKKRSFLESQLNFWRIDGLSIEYIFTICSC